MRTSPFDRATESGRLPFIGFRGEDRILQTSERGVERRVGVLFSSLPIAHHGARRAFQ
jgi:hypothetical protein